MTGCRSHVTAVHTTTCVWPAPQGLKAKSSLSMSMHKLIQDHLAFKHPALLVAAFVLPAQQPAATAV